MLLVTLSSERSESLDDLFENTRQRGTVPRIYLSWEAQHTKRDIANHKESIGVAKVKILPDPKNNTSVHISATMVRTLPDSHVRRSRVRTQLETSEIRPLCLLQECEYTFLD